MGFVSTRWSLVQRLRKDGDESRVALDELCQTYWPAVFAHIRAKGYSPTDAEDLTQGFFAFVLDKQVFARADMQRGRFRNFLKAAVKNFLANEYDKTTAQKRGGNAVHLNLDDAPWLASADYGHGADHEFDRAWGLTLLSRALARLEKEYADRGRADVFAALKPILTGEGVDATYAAIGESLGISESAVKLTVRRMRLRFRDLLKAEIEDTVSSVEEAETEFADLRSLFT
jgi:DNA-directed RNA polymerase specialized sigma24 family protein